MTFYALRQKFHLQNRSGADMIIDMGERIAGKQNRPSLIIEAPPPSTHTPNNQNINVSHSDPYMKTCLLIVFPCCIYPNCDEVSIC